MPCDIQYLDLTDNRLTNSGEIRQLVTTMSDLVSVSVAGNNLGEIDFDLFHQCGKLEAVDLSGNNLK